MKRKIIKQGNNTLTITLPKNWTEKKNIKAGDEIELSEFEEITGHQSLICGVGRDKVDLASLLALVLNVVPLVDATTGSKSRQVGLTFTDFVVVGHVFVHDGEVQGVAELHNWELPDVVFLPLGVLTSVGHNAGLPLVLAALELNVGVHLAH